MFAWRLSDTMALSAAYNLALFLALALALACGLPIFHCSPLRDLIAINTSVECAIAKLVNRAAEAEAASTSEAEAASTSERAAGSDDAAARVRLEREWARNKQSLRTAVRDLHNHAVAFRGSFLVDSKEEDRSRVTVAVGASEWNGVADDASRAVEFKQYLTGVNYSV